MFSFAGDLTKFSLVQSEKSAAGSKHCFLFNGEAFEQKEEFRMLKSYFLDFYRGDVISSVNLSGLDHVVSISASQEGKVCFLFACATVVLTPSLPPFGFCRSTFVCTMFS